MMASYKGRNTTHCVTQYCITNIEVTDCPPVHSCSENVTMCTMKRKELTIAQTIQIIKKLARCKLQWLLQKNMPSQQTCF